MFDSYLNSVHLPAPRREAFRHARQVLLEAGSDASQRSVKRSSAPDDRCDTFVGLSSPRPGVRATCGLVLVHQGGVHPFAFGVNPVGRLPDNHIVLGDASVSRRHCAVLVHADQSCEVHDTASRNGTYLNGRRINGPTRLRPGDEIRLGDCRLVLRYADDLGDPPA